jgi:hypothetical protein
MAGCKQEQPESSAGSDANHVKEEIAEAANATGAFLSQQSQEFLDGAQETFSQLEQDTQQLAADLKASGKESWDMMRAELAQKQATAQQKLKELKSASQENWEDTKEAFEVAVKELKDAYQKAKAEFDAGENANDDAAMG